jgi:hypothetical protein
MGELVMDAATIVPMIRSILIVGSVVLAVKSYFEGNYPKAQFIMLVVIGAIIESKP